MISKKQCILPLLGSACLVGAQHTSAGVILAAEDYNDGSGNGVGLTYTDGSVTIGEAGASKGRDAAQQYIDLSSSVNTGQLYIRALMQRNSDGGWGGISPFAGGNERVYFGKSGDNLRIQSYGGGGNSSSLSWSADQTYLVVAMIDFENDLVKLWLNPELTGSEPTASTSITGYTNTSAITRIRLDAAGDDDLLFDEVVVGTEWSDVVVPEPSSLALLGLGGLCMLKRRRRNA